jgi:hypothetical protein
MNKETIKAFMAWLEKASDEEIRERLRQIQDLENAGGLTREGRADLRLARRLIDEELIARLDLSRAAGGHD